MNRTIRVPLAVDAQVRVPFGPVMLPLRAVAIMAATAPIDLFLLTVNFAPASWRLGGIFVLLTLAYTVSTPMHQGVWIGTHWLYKLSNRLLPSIVEEGHSKRARVTSIGAGGLQVEKVHAPFARGGRFLAPLRYYATLPTPEIVKDGLMALRPGGARAVLRLQGPPVSVASDDYVAWCNSFVAWLVSLEIPAQFITVVNHFDSARARAAFDRRTQGWTRKMLGDFERDLVGDLAEQSLGLEHYVVFAPSMSGKTGIPEFSKLTKVSQVLEATEAEGERVLNSAVRLAPSFNLKVEPATQAEMVGLLRQSILGTTRAVVGGDDLHFNDQHHVVMTMTKLPHTIECGAVVEAIMRSRSRGIASLHILPVAEMHARDALNKRTAMYKYAARQGNGDVDNEVAIMETTSVLAAMAQRELRPFRVALTMAVSHADRTKAAEAAERFHGIMTGHGFDVELASSPGFLPALALAPGGAPLGRSLQMTSDGVAVRMLPALGTPFSDQTKPLVGINALTGAPAHFSIWTPPNHNLVVLGSSGAGKSVATKTLLIRHVMEGASAVVIDPDSEYRHTIRSIGGEYYELGDAALNPLAAGMNVAPDTAASLVLPILSVMGGDEKGVKDGRPIRRLPDEDQGWVHAEVADFYRHWAARGGHQEPLMGDLITFIDTTSKARALTEREAERCRIITSRLRRYTQGRRALVFNRPSTFTVGKVPVAIGLRAFAMSYGADLTPALAVVLTSILAALERREGRMIVVVDEAHRVTSDPDAGEVLGQLVRQARKYGAGVWMCSQRVEDFVRTELGRTLAATASSKLILGAEEAVSAEVSEVFKLRSEEAAALTPMQQGRGVLLSAGERTVVNVVPGPAIMLLAGTSGALEQSQRRDGDVPVAS